MKFIKCYTVDFIENLLPHIGDDSNFSTEKIVYGINRDLIIWSTIIIIKEIDNEILDMNGRFCKTLFRFIDGSEMEFYVDIKTFKKS